MRRFEKDLTLRCTGEQRDFLEKFARENDIGICAAARHCINKTMKLEV